MQCDDVIYKQTDTLVFGGLISHPVREWPSWRRRGNIANIENPFSGGGEERGFGLAGLIPDKSERIILLSVNLSKDVKYQAEAAV